MTVLVVEDEANIRKFITSNLEARGYDTAEAPSAEAALDLLAHLRPAAMILDIKLPGMTGWQLLSQISRDVGIAYFPVIVMTAHGVEHDERADYTAWIVDVLTKPTTSTELIDAVRRALGEGAAGIAPVRLA